MNDLKPDDKVLTLPLTHNRNTYALYTKAEDLPADVQKIANKRGLIKKYGDLIIEKTNIDFEKEAKQLKTENLRLKKENDALRKNAKHLEGLLKEKESGKDK